MTTFLIAIAKIKNFWFICLLLNEKENIITPAVQSQLSSYPKHLIVSVKLVSYLKYSFPLAVLARIYVPAE